MVSDGQLIDEKISNLLICCWLHMIDCKDQICSGEVCPWWLKGSEKINVDGGYVLRHIWWYSAKHISPCFSTKNELQIQFVFASFSCICLCCLTHSMYFWQYIVRYIVVHFYKYNLFLYVFIWGCFTSHLIISCQAYHHFPLSNKIETTLPP